MIRNGFIGHWFILFILCSVNGRSQDRLEMYIPLPPQELTVEQYLYHIEDVTELRLSFSREIVEEKRFALYSDSMVLHSLLDTLFSKHEINYIIRGDKLILAPIRDITSIPDHLLIEGTIRNTRNQNGIPYATIAIPSGSTGTISNFEGRYQLVLPKNPQSDSLVISSMGYIMQKVSIDELLTNGGDIDLDPHRFQIDELIIRPQKPIQLIEAAIERKAENYPEEPALLYAFFRETAMQDGKYISLSEAIIDIYKTGYLSSQPDQVRLVRGRRGENVEHPELINLVVEGGLYNNLQLDLMKYGVGFLDPEMFQYYDYEFRKQITFNRRPTYVVTFNYKDNLPMAGFNGSLYIDAASLAVVRVEFEISEESLDKAYQMLIKKTPMGYRIQPRYARYVIEYRLYDGKWNLSQARSEVALKVRKKRGRDHKGFTTLLSTASEFVITGKSEEEFEKIRYREASKPTDILYEQVAETGVGFWGNKNIILPEEPLLITIERLKRQAGSPDEKYVKTD